MGDIFPYGPAAYVTWQQAYDWFANEGYPSSVAATFAAIGTAESSLDYRVINDTPSTGDYSVGIWQINYYGSLYASRTAAFGTPQTLVQFGLSLQAFAALQIWKEAGQSWRPWSTYNDGAYLAYMHGYSGSGGTSTAGQPTISEGATGSAVRLLQTDLDLLGYGLAVDGDFGPATLNAVLSFQTGHNLARDGIVGPLTWAALGAAVSSQQQPVQPGQPPPATAPPPPNEPPGNVDPDTVSTWSSLVGASQGGLNASTQTINGYVNAIGGFQ